MIRRLLCFAGIHARVLRHDFDGTYTTVCRGCEPLRYALLTELMEQRPPFGYAGCTLDITPTAFGTHFEVTHLDTDAIVARFEADILAEARARTAARRAATR